MKEKELIKIALYYIKKGYSNEQLRDGDALYDATREEKDVCSDYYNEIREKGTDWAQEMINFLKDK